MSTFLLEFLASLSVLFGIYAKLSLRFAEEPPNIVEFTNSSGVMIPCRVEGSPLPTITWVTAENELLTDIPSLRYVRSDGTLVFLPFSSDNYRPEIHTSTYRCLGSNSVGTIGSSDVHVRAVLLQGYEIRVFDEFVLRDNMALMRCQIPSSVSDHVKIVSWEINDGFLITPGISNGKYGMIDTGELYIRDITEADSGSTFRCNTENRLTSERKMSSNSSKIFITSPQDTQPPRIIRRTGQKLVMENQEANLICMAQGTPAPSYRWYRLKDGHLVAPDNGHQNEGVLFIQSVKISDSGEYVCVVNNNVGEDKATVELLVEEPLKIEVSPQEIQAEIGGSFVFNCSVSGSPAGSVVWKKDMKFLSRSSKVTFVSPNVLEILHVRRQDVGMYQCFTYKDLHSAQATAQIFIGDVPPEFKTAFSEKTLHPGAYLSLLCVSVGSPLPKITWTVDGIWKLTTKPGLVINSYTGEDGDVISYVNISSVDVRDGGFYGCVASNYAGRIVHTQRINVYGQLFVRPLTNLTALAGDTFTVFCPFGGYPFSNIIWKKEGRRLHQTQRQKAYSNGSLVIGDVQRSQDDGRYTCEVSNAHGISVQRTFTLIVRSGPKIGPFSFPDDMQEGMRTAVTCIVVAGDGPINISWLKDGRHLDEHDPDISIMSMEGGYVSTLTVKTLSYRHHGNYTCLASNDVATGSLSALLTVKVPPRWLLEPRDSSGVVGRQAVMNCQADGVPQPTVRWKLSSGGLEQYKTIVSNSHMHILVNGSLVIKSVEENDQGFYLCEANNGVGSGVSTVVKFAVHSGPQFDSRFIHQNAKKGDHHVLECKATGDRPIKFYWRKNGVLIDFKDPRYTVDLEEKDGGEVSKLSIEKIQRKDSSLFTCVAQNRYGEDVKNLQLTVQDVPDPPQHLEVNDVTSRSARLSWVAAYTGNSPITQYTIYWRQKEGKDDGPTNQISVPGRDTSAVVRDLLPMSTYYFSIRASNSLGDSELSSESIGTTLEEPPRHVPKSVKATALSSDSISVTWKTPEDETDTGRVDGYYVGYKIRGSTDSFTFKTVEIITPPRQEVKLSHLQRATEYSIVVQAFNTRGAGPPSEEILMQTLKYDRPGTPVTKTFFTTSTTIKLLWELSSSPYAPVTGYILYHKRDGIHWQETNQRGDKTTYVYQNLQCGTAYNFYIVAFNEAGRGDPSEEISARTDGNAPIAPDKAQLLSANSTFALLHLNSWQSGGCPINFFVIQCKPRGQQEWTLVSNNVVPDQQVSTIPDLSPGSWYSLLMTAHNDAGSTDAEYIFATLTVDGETPPHPSDLTGVNSSLYRHMTVTVPAVSSVLILVIVLSAVLLITRKRIGQLRQQTTDNSDNQVKTENVTLSTSSDQAQEVLYIPATYDTNRLPMYSREQSNLYRLTNVENIAVFEKAHGEFHYDIPYPPRQRPEKRCNPYETTGVIYHPASHKVLSQRYIRKEVTRYEIPDRQMLSKEEEDRQWREAGDGSSSTDSDNEDIIYSLHSSPSLATGRDDARECSETECDRMWIGRPVLSTYLSSQDS